MIKHTADRSTVVDTSVHWIDARETPPPRGSKLLCINKRLGVAVLSVWIPDFKFTHWAPLPTFRKDNDANA